MRTKRSERFSSDLESLVWETRGTIPRTSDIVRGEAVAYPTRVLDSFASHLVSHAIGNAQSPLKRCTTLYVRVYIRASKGHHSWHDRGRGSPIKWNDTGFVDYEIDHACGKSPHNCFKGDQGLRKVVGECGMKRGYIWLSSVAIFRIFTNCQLEWNSTFAESGTQELFPSIRLHQLIKHGTSSFGHTEGSSSSAEYD